MATEPIIAVLSAHRHPRLRYTLKEMSRDLGWQLRLMTDPVEWAELTAAGKIAYGVEATAAEPHLYLPAHPFVQGGAVSAKDLRTTAQHGMPVFFAVADRFDYVAMIFYALARYEEYQPFTPDAHHRFSATESHAFKNGYLTRPVVREWTVHLGRQLREVFPDLPKHSPAPFNFRPTYDIDLLWAWQHRGLRGFAAGIRDVFTGHLRRGLRRFFTPAAQDPYFTLPFLESLHQQYDLQPLWFWLVADRQHREDPNPYPVPAAQRALIRELATRYTCGVHPSYASSENAALIRQEADRLTAIMGKAPLHSRQHFLRFRLPTTYRALRLAGITHDYSMGYADAIGWRAGTNQPFFWYDLEREEATGLLIHPFAAMDATLKNYLGLSPQAAKSQVLELARKTIPFGGEFLLLWHNSSFAPAYGWAGWQEMYESLVAALATMRTVDK